MLLSRVLKALRPPPPKAPPPRVAGLFAPPYPAAGWWHDDPTEQLRNYRSWVYAAVNAIAQEAARRQPFLYRNTGQAEHEQVPLPHTHPLCRLLDNPNPWLTPWELWYLFAIDEPSMFNPDAPVLDADTIARFRSDPLLRHRLRRSFDRWMAFCGIIRTDDCLVFGNPNPGVWSRQNHNWLRITRVLRSLRLLGLPEDAQAFFGLLTTIRSRIDPTTWGYWERAAHPES